MTEQSNAEETWYFEYPFTQRQYREVAAALKLAAKQGCDTHIVKKVAKMFLKQAEMMEEAP